MTRASSFYDGTLLMRGNAAMQPICSNSPQTGRPSALYFYRKLERERPASPTRTDTNKGLCMQCSTLVLDHLSEPHLKRRERREHLWPRWPKEVQCCLMAFLFKGIGDHNIKTVHCSQQLNGSVATCDDNIRVAVLGLFFRWGCKHSCSLLESPHSDI